MAYGTYFAETQRTRGIRWTCAAMLAIALHAGAALTLLYPRVEDDADPAGAIAIELAPVTAALALVPTEVAPGPLMQEEAPAPETRKQTNEKVAEEVPRVEPAPLAPEPTVKVPDPQPEKKVEVDNKAAPEQKSQQALAAPMTTVPPPAEAKPSDAAVAPAPGLSAIAGGVMRDIAEPKLLVRGSSSPHTYALTPSDAAALYDAAVLFRVSPQLEPFTPRIVRALPKEVQVVSTRTRAPSVRRGPAFERNSGHVARAGGLDVVDGHAWLDPENAKAMVAYVAETLTQIDPTHAETFRSNAQELRQRLELLQRELEQALKPVTDRPYVVFHDAMHYFERRFNLNAVGSISVSPDIPPSGARMLELRRKLRAVGAQCAFAEPQFSMALVGAVVEGTGARVGMLDPEAINLAPGPDLYFTLMRKLAADLTRCLTMPA
jgi:zinc transport system substrate-binding protein